MAEPEMVAASKIYGFLQNMRDSSKTEEDKLAETMRVSSEALGQVRDEQEFADKWLGLSFCQILR